MPERSDRRDRAFLLPPSLDEWTATDHPVRFVDAFVEALDDEAWTALGVTVRPAAVGAPRYAPRLLLKIWIAGFMGGNRSVRGLERACREQLPMRWLTANQTPDHNTLSRFYRAHRAQMGELLARSVRTAMAMGLVDLALLAIDGTKIRANVAAARSLDAVALAKVEGLIQAAIADLESQNQGDDPPPPSLPSALRSQEALLARVRAASAEVAAQTGPTGTTASGSTPQANLTDPEARWMKTTTGFAPGYNVQAAVVRTPEQQANCRRGRIIAAVDVTTQRTDQHQLSPMLTAAIASLGTPPDLAVTDSGYHNGGCLAVAAELGIPVVATESSVLDPKRAPYHRAAFAYDPETDTLTCPQGQTLNRRSTAANGRRYGGDPAVCRACPAFGECTRNSQAGRIVTLTAHDQLRQAHRRWMETPAAKAAVAQRKSLIEPVFGILKEVQQARRTLLRGLANVTAEWQLLATAFNLRCLARLWAANSTATAASDRPQRRTIVPRYAVPGTQAPLPLGLPPTS